MVPLLLACALASSPGPTPPPVKGLLKPIPLSADARDYVKWALSEMGQAVVVVEGEYAQPLPKIPASLRMFNNNLSLFKVRLPQPGEIPAPFWTDPNVTMSGGNVVQRMYPLGWGY